MCRILAPPARGVNLWRPIRGNKKGGRGLLSYAAVLGVVIVVAGVFVVFVEPVCACMLLLNKNQRIALNADAINA